MVEAQYADFLDETRLAGRWSAAFVARALAELAALHPRLPIVFAGYRKLANQWTHRFLAACAAHRASPQRLSVRDAPQGELPFGEVLSPDERVRLAVMQPGRSRFALAEVVAEVEGASVVTVRRVVKALEREGKVRCLGRGRGARWVVVGEA